MNSRMKILSMLSVATLLVLWRQISIFFKQANVDGAFNTVAVTPPPVHPASYSGKEEGEGFTQYIDDSYHAAIEVGKIPLSWPPLPDFAQKITNTQPIMSCIGSDKVLDRLVFIHMFKTAGSTIRTLFREYSKKCDRGWVCVTDCSDLDPSSFIGKESIDAVWQPREDSKTWDNPPKCRIKDQVTRTDSRDVEFERPPDNERIRNNADILGGHLSLGVNPWAQQDHINVRYLTFVRDTPIKFVSGLIYTTFQMDPATTTTVQQMSVKIKKRILKARDKVRENPKLVKCESRGSY